MNTPPPIRCVIFDCDGTLVDSEQIAIDILVQMAGELGAGFANTEAMQRWRGMRLSLCLEDIAQRLGAPLPQDFAPDFRRRSAQAFAHGLKIVPGAMELVRGMSLPFCVASSGPREKIELNLSLTGLLPHFQGRIFSAYEVNSWKPDPGLFLHAAKNMGFAPAECLVVEDSWPGVAGALAAGMLVVAYQPHAVDPRIPPEVPLIRELTQLPPLLT